MIRYLVTITFILTDTCFDIRLRLQLLSNQLTQVKKGTLTALSGSFGVLLRWTRAWTAQIVFSVQHNDALFRLKIY